MFKDCLLEIKRYLITNKEPKDIMFKCVQNRLNKSNERYYEDLIASCNYIESKNALKVMKAIVQRSEENDIKRK